MLDPFVPWVMMLTEGRLDVANVGELKDTARGVVMDQIDRRSTDLGNTVGEHVANLRNVSESLRSQGHDHTARLVDMAAERAYSVSAYLTNTDGDRMVHDLEQLARSQPLATAAVGLIAGLTAARLLKSAAAERYERFSTYGVR